MNEPVRVGIIICDRYRTCAGGKCFRALHAQGGRVQASTRIARWNWSASRRAADAPAATSSMRRRR